MSRRRTAANVIEITIPGPPVPKGRPRAGRTGFYTPTRTAQFEETVAWAARAQRVRLGQGPVEVQADFYTRAGGGDLDNLLKSCLDGLVKGGAIDDDNPMVVRAVSARWFHDPHQERTELRLIHRNAGQEPALKGDQR